MKSLHITFQIMIWLSAFAGFLVVVILAAIIGLHLAEVAGQLIRLPLENNPY